MASSPVRQIRLLTVTRYLLRSLVNIQHILPASLIAQKIFQTGISPEEERTPSESVNTRYTYMLLKNRSSPFCRISMFHSWHFRPIPFCNFLWLIDRYLDFWYILVIFFSFYNFLFNILVLLLFNRWNELMFSYLQAFLFNYCEGYRVDRLFLIYLMQS